MRILLFYTIHINNDFEYRYVIFNILHPFNQLKARLPVFFIITWPFLKF